MTDREGSARRKTVVIVGALDSKGAEFDFVKRSIERLGARTIVVDFGVMGSPAFTPDISRSEVAAEGGGEIDALATGDRKDEAMRTQASGLAVIIRRLFDDGRLDGVIGMGGTGGTSIATTAMRTLPVGVPKLMVSTVGGSDVSPFAGTKDVTFMPSIVDVAGFNRISRRIYANAAGAIVGMVMAEPQQAEDKPLIVASMFGNTTEAVDHARTLLEQRDYEVLVFHATGSGGRTMEGLIEDGFITGSLDLTTTELADDVCGGILSAGPDRGLAASRAGVPAVIVPGCVDMANFGRLETVPDRYRDRKLYQWNPDTTLLRTNEDENREIGRRLARIANEATGPVTIMLPLRGVSMLDSEGGKFWDPQADRACFEAIKAGIDPSIPLIELDLNINEPAFAERAVDELLSLLAEVGAERVSS